MATPYVFLTTVVNKENSTAGADIVADTNSQLYFQGIPALNNDRFNPMLSIGAESPSIYSNVNYALIQWPDEVEPRRYYVNYKNVTVDNTIMLGLNQDYLATFATFFEWQNVLVKEATQPNTLTTETHNIGIDTDIPIDPSEDYSIQVAITSPFIDKTSLTSAAYGGGVVVFGTALEEVTNSVTGSAEPFKGMWFAKINNVKYYAITLRSFAALVQKIYDKLLSLDNDKGKYDQLQSAIREVIYYPLDERFLYTAVTPQYAHLRPRYTLPDGYTRNNDGTVSYSDGSTTKTVKLHIEGNSFQLAEPVGASYPDMHIDENGFILDASETDYLQWYIPVFKLPHVLDASEDIIDDIPIMFVNFTPATSVMGKVQTTFAPYVAKIEFNQTIEETANNTTVFRNGPRALNLEPLTTLTMSCGPFGTASIPLEKVYKYVPETTKHSIYLSFEMILDVLTGDAILRIFTDYLPDTSVREKLTELKANIACTLAMETITNNNVTYLSMIGGALKTIAAGAASGLGAAISMGSSLDLAASHPIVQAGGRIANNSGASTAAQSASVFMSESGPGSIHDEIDTNIHNTLYSRGALAGLGAGSIAAGVSLMKQSRDVDRTYTKFSGWLDYCVENWFLDFHYKTPMFDDPDDYPVLYPVYKVMWPYFCRGHLIKGSLFKPTLGSLTCLVPTKDELNAIRELLEVGVWVNHTATVYTYTIGAGITLTKSSGGTFEGPTTAYVYRWEAVGKTFTANKDITINGGEPILAGTPFAYPLYDATFAEVVIPAECTATIADDITIAQYIGDTATGTTYTDGTFTLPIDIAEPEQGGPTTYNYRCSVKTVWNETEVEADTGFTPEDRVEYDVIKYVAPIVNVELVISSDGMDWDNSSVDIVESGSLPPMTTLNNGTYTLLSDTVVGLYDYYGTVRGSKYTVTQGGVSTEYLCGPGQPTGGYYRATINVDKNTTIVKSSYWI